MAFRPQENIPLAPLTTLELGGPARFFTEVQNEAELRTALAWAKGKQQRSTVLGGGSNLIVPDSGFDGLVLRIATSGFRAEKRGSQVLLRVGAGEEWTALVERAVTDMSLAGLECLAGIPGLVGATPIQNVGAYGTEVSHLIHELLVFDLGTEECSVWKNEACGFSYRNSIFKQHPNRFVVLEVSFLLHAAASSPVHYAELEKRVGKRAEPQKILDAVLELRRGKSMVIEANDPNRRSAGSFFTHPIIEGEKVNHLHEVAKQELGIDKDDVPVWPYGSKYKVPAGWLIEKAGFQKGTRRGAVGISSKHALALVHHGGGTTAELLRFAKEIQERVQELFSISIEPEPRLM